MEDKSIEISQQLKSANSSQIHSLAQDDQLATSIERAVRRETSGGVRNLHVEVGRGGIILQGLCDTFYCKQLAQHAAMEISDDTLTNQIKVS